MALTPSTMLALGTEAPDFTLPDTAGEMVSLGEILQDAARHAGPTGMASPAEGAPALLVMFICNHCPYVKHVRSELAKLGREYELKGVAVVAINSNDATAYPDDSPEAMAREKAAVGYTFPYLYDEDQSVAHAYRAACTPDLYLFDRARKLVYRGQLDASRPGNAIPVTGRDLRAALDAVLAGAPVPDDQKPSIGCNIKWKPGREPA